MRAENHVFDEIELGDSASIERVVTDTDFVVFAAASGNLNPWNQPCHPANGQRDVGAPAMWLGALISAVLGNRLPGPGTIYRAQSLTFHKRAHEGDRLTVSAKVIEKRPPQVVLLETRIMRGAELIADGVAEVRAPDEKCVFTELEAPHLLIESHEKADRLIAACDGLPPLSTAVVAPEDEASIEGALLAARHRLITPLFVGDRSRIETAASAAGLDISGIAIEDVAGARAAAARAATLAASGKVAAVMKGYLHSDDLLGELLKSDAGLRGHRRVSHVFIMDVPGLAHLLFVTDAAINIAPDLTDKVDIVQNAIDVARALGVNTPKVGVLSAVETVNPKIPSTLDAAALAKMSERGQIVGGIVDGPLAMDNAVDLAAAKTKGIHSLVAGVADVLVVPNLEAGNMLAKELTFIAHAEAAGIVLGLKVPVMLTSRADSDKARLASAAVAVLFQHFQMTGRSRLDGLGSATP